MRIVVLTTDLPEANSMTERLLEKFSGEVAGVLRSTAIVPGKSTWEGLKFLGRRMGASPLLWLGATRTVLGVAASFSRLTWRRPKTDTLRGLCRRYGTPIYSTKRLDASALRTLKGWAPDLLVSVYFNQVLRSHVLAIPTRGSINVHPSLLPSNRGLLPCHWALGNGHRETGVSVHWIENELDTGQLLRQTKVPIHAADSVLALSYRCAAAGAELLADAIGKIRDGDAESFPQKTDGVSYFSWPDRACIRRLRQRGHKLGGVVEMWQRFAA